MTIEDPVEYRLPLIRQTQVNLKAGVTFATGLRSLLRQDPDVIMVGEIRDQDTAEIAIQAALTGHLVLSTLHTNDAVGAVARLLDMGIESYLLASTLLGLVAQRLVRRICPHCQEGSRPDPELRKRHPTLSVVYRGRGCRFCRKTGFLGRIGISELFRVDEQAKALIASKRPSDELRRKALARGMRSMREDGLLKVQQGLSSLEEVDRVVPAEPSR
jgi:type IV pilus assembly protein PilB